MIDSTLRAAYQKIFVNPILKRFERRNLNPNVITLLGLMFGIAVLPALAMGYLQLAITALLTSGYLDTLDGSMARTQNRSTPQGAVYDIVSDRIVEFCVVLGLYFVDPQSRGLLCLLMIGSILLCITSFLVVAIFLKNETEKGFHYDPGLMERTEAFIFFICMICFPSLFSPLALLFTFLVSLTAIMRIRQFNADTLKA